MHALAALWSSHPRPSSHRALWLMSLTSHILWYVFIGMCGKYVGPPFRVYFLICLCIQAVQILYLISWMVPWYNTPQRWAMQSGNWESNYTRDACQIWLKLSLENVQVFFPNEKEMQGWCVEVGIWAWQFSMVVEWKWSTTCSARER